MQSKPNKVLKFFFGNTFLAILNFLTIVGFIAIFVTNTQYAIISLVAFCVFLLIILIRIFWVTDQFLQRKSLHGIDKLSTSVKYLTRDGKQIVYEMKKFIQCKQILTDTHEHEYHWTGSSGPNISSETMDYISEETLPNGFKKAVFRYKKPLIYNSVYVAHIKMEIDDTDKKSSTHIEQFVKEPMQLVSFKVQLLYKKGNVPDARLCRRRLESSTMTYETIKAIPFDKKTSSYEYNLYNPEVGWGYKIEWNR